MLKQVKFFCRTLKTQDQRDNDGFFWPKDLEKMDLSWEWSHWWQPSAIIGHCHRHPIPIKCRADHWDSLNTRRPLLWGNKEAIAATWEDSTALICGGKSSNREVFTKSSLDRLVSRREQVETGQRTRILLLTVCPTSLSHLLPKYRMKIQIQIQIQTQTGQRTRVLLQTVYPTVSSCSSTSSPSSPQSSSSPILEIQYFAGDNSFLY